MCRLFGWAGQEPTSAATALGKDVEHLQRLSHVHQDGWGVAWQAADGLHLVRDAGPAHAAADFEPTLAAAVGFLGVVHLRWATGDIPVCLPNTHPFVRGQVAFCHNGSVPDHVRLDALVDADLLDSMAGTNDSERYFLALLSARRRGASVSEAFAEVIGALDDVEFPSLNAMWAEPGKLYVVAAHHVERRPAGTMPDYYDLQYETAGGITTVWSTQVRDDVGVSLPNWSILTLTTESGGVAVSAL
jgi:predicted glutamine amidotransferase